MKQQSLALDQSREARFVRAFRTANPRSRATGYFTTLPGASVRRYQCVACKREIARDVAHAGEPGPCARAALTRHSERCEEIAKYVPLESAESLTRERTS